MREVATVLGGIGLLIFVYLLVANYNAIGPILGSATGALTDTITVLQGRGGNSLPAAPSFGGSIGFGGING